VCVCVCVCVQVSQAEKRQLEEWRHNVALMVYRTVRDVYNADAVPVARIEN
jgi:hypothetical protein